MTSADPRPYEIILLGANGVTGKYCAEYVATHLPTDLRWAVAGRSASKLEAVVKDIAALNADRRAPAIETITSLTDGESLASLCLKTRLLVSCVGPYTLYGEPVVRACAEAGTHYIDTTGEIPWVARMIKRYEEVARASGAVLIPQCGFESSASDMLVYEAVSTLRRQARKDAGHVHGTVWATRAQASGGTLASIFTILSTFPTRELLASQVPFALADTSRRVRPAKAPLEPPRSVGRKLTGTFVHPAFGPQGIWFMGGANRAIVGRTWSLFGPGAVVNPGYSDSFTYSETVSSRSRLLSIALNLVLGFAGLAIAIPPVRYLISRLVMQPGIGPERTSDAKSFCVLRAEAEAADGSGVKCQSRLAWKGSVYHLTAVLMMEAAATLVRDEEGVPAKKLGGGFLTPATLGDSYAERLRKGGVDLSAKIV